MEEAMIEIRNLTKSYVTQENTFNALEDISFTVEDGDLFGIIGMSGAGKSTLLNVISGLIKPNQGEILIDGEIFDYEDEKRLKELRKKIGFVFQGYHLLMQKTVYENIAFPLRIQKKNEEEIKQTVDELIIKVGLVGKENVYPAKLSGGQKQRVAIARALVNKPRLLLLDEPTSALDSLTTKEIIRLLQHIHKEEKVTMLLITHEINVARILTNKVLVIDQGRFIELKNTEDIFLNPESEIAKLLLGKEVQP
ncbi:MAG: ATP-binding cassette domain-containing protein [Firmicutes bacterium]|nr:ATP-binding cassette domain-containing protein [Bacillota bacterium]